MSNDKKTVFEHDGTEYAIIKPTAKLNEDATMEYNRVFSKTLKNDGILRERIEQHMREQHLWDDEKEEAYVGVLKQIGDKEKSLKAGGIKLTEAKDLAIDIRTLRAVLQNLISQRQSLDSSTVQGQAENARFNYLLVQCLVYNDSGDRVYKDVGDYLSSQDIESGSSLAFAVAEKFGNTYFGLDEEYDKKLPENEFLVKWKFADEELRLIDKEGRLISYDGKLIDADNRYIDEDGNFIDLDGNLVNEDGEPALDAKPFLNDEGLPIDADGNILEESHKEQDKPKKKRGRPAKVKAETTTAEDT